MCRARAGEVFSLAYSPSRFGGAGASTPGFRAMQSLGRCLTHIHAYPHGDQRLLKAYCGRVTTRHQAAVSHPLLRCEERKYPLTCLFVAHHATVRCLDHQRNPLLARPRPAEQSAPVRVPRWRFQTFSCISQSVQWVALARRRGPALRLRPAPRRSSRSRAPWRSGTGRAPYDAPTLATSGSRWHGPGPGDPGSGTAWLLPAGSWPWRRT
jgi:hypothetical protein